MLINEYVTKYHNSGILIDTNLLLMLFVGSVGEVGDFKRTYKYQTSDYQLLLNFADKFKSVITTPNILTEVSNLAGSNNMYGEKLDNFFKKFTAALETKMPEKYIPSQSIAKQNICKYGLTDAGIIDLVKDKYLLLTDDLPLYTFAAGQKIDAINFNHLRS